MRHVSAVSFRQAEAGDANAIGILHVVSWRESYVGILPDQVLEGLSAEAQSDMWRSVLTAKGDLPAVFIATSENEVIGFGACGEQRDASLKKSGFDGEIGALYILKAYQGTGLGVALMRLMAASLLGAGRRAASVWVLQQNVRARAFYERLGGVLVREKREDLGDATFVEVAYAWRDLYALKGR